MSVEQLEAREDLFEEADPEPAWWIVLFRGRRVKVCGRQQWRSRAAAIGAVHARLRKVSLRNGRRPDKELCRVYIERNLEIRKL